MGVGPTGRISSCEPAGGPKTLAITVQASPTPGGGGMNAGATRNTLHEARPGATSMLFVPQAGGTDPGVLAPGGRLFLVGRYFGDQPGRIVLKGANGLFGSGYRYGEVELVDPTWESDTRVNGRIPADLVQPMERANVEIRVHRADGVTSAALVQPFEVPSETRWLGFEDVELVECGKDSNYYSCNGHWGKGDTCFDTSVGFDYEHRSDAAIQGYHENCESTVGDDVGTDHYRIRLVDGWVFDSLSWKAERPKPDFPKGASYWAPSFSWTVEPGEELNYWAKVRVRRPAK